jgi:hypothetical protein
VRARTGSKSEANRKWQICEIANRKSAPLRGKEATSGLTGNESEANRKWRTGRSETRASRLLPPRLGGAAGCVLPRPCAALPTLWLPQGDLHCKSGDPQTAPLPLLKPIWEMPRARTHARSGGAR